MTRTSSLLTLGLSLLPLLAAGCHHSSRGGQPSTDASTHSVELAADDKGVFVLSECPSWVDTRNSWGCTQIDAAPVVELPGGAFQPEPTCLAGEPFGFYSRFDADKPDLLIHLQAGGHCLGSQCAGWFEGHRSAAAKAPMGGIFDLDQSDNPFRTYNQVRIPYCSGDAHAGHVSLTEPGVEGWQQHGFDNVVATLAYLSETHGEQLRGGRVVFAGSSAGGVATILDSPLLATFFPDSKISVLTDSAAGIQTCYDLRSSYDAWDFGHNLALMGIERAPTCALDIEPGSPPAAYLGGFLLELWADLIEQHGDWSFAYVGAHHDKTQSTMDLDEDQQVCAQCVFASGVARMLERAGVLSSFVYGGTQHTILGSLDLYKPREVVSAGEQTTSLSAASWLGQWLDAPISYACESCRSTSDCSSCSTIPCACPGQVSCPGPELCPAAIIED